MCMYIYLRLVVLCVHVPQVGSIVCTYTSGMIRLSCVYMLPLKSSVLSSTCLPRRTIVLCSQTLALFQNGCWCSPFAETKPHFKVAGKNGSGCTRLDEPCQSVNMEMVLFKVQHL